LKQPPVKVAVAGLTLREAREQLTQRLQAYYRFRDDQILVSVSVARSIRVSIYGEIARVGTITIPATNSIWNVIAAAGGPTDRGTLRNIRVVSDGNTRYIDFYDLLGNSGEFNEFYLTDNSIIHIPPSRSRVYIDGEVQRQMYYDLLPDEGILDLIEIAGGLRPNAYQSQLSVLRYQDDQLVMQDINVRNLRETGGDYELKDGDRITVPSIPEYTENIFTIEGEVYKPGRYQLFRGMTVRDALSKAGVLNSTRLDLAYLERLEPNNQSSYTRLSIQDIESSEYGQIELQTGDRLIIYSLERFTDQQTFTVYGAVRDSGTFNTDVTGELKVSDAIELAGGMTRNASGLVFIQRSASTDMGARRYLRVDMNRLDEGLPETDLTIQGGDTIYVEDGSLFLEETFVEITGEVNVPGRYDYGTDLTIRDLIFLSSGFTPRAARNRIDVSRLILRENQAPKTEVFSFGLDDDLEADQEFALAPYDRIVVRTIQDYELQRLVEIKGEVDFPGPYAILKDNQRLSELIAMAGGLTDEAFPGGATLFRKADSTGYIVMKLDEVIRRPRSRYDYILKEGDEILIPKRRQLVEISGAVNATELYPDKFINSNNSIKVPLHENENAKFYLDNYAAGVSDIGDKDLITVEHANGQIASVRRVFFIRKYPKVYEGSKIYVGYKKPELPKEEKTREKVNWGEIVGQTLAQATAVLSLILLARELRRDDME